MELLGRLSEGNHQFKANLGQSGFRASLCYLVMLYLKMKSERAEADVKAAAYNPGTLEAEAG